MVEFIGVQEETRGKLNAVASGTLSNGDTVVVNADGTVSAVAGAAQATGTPVVFEAANTLYVASVFDPTENKVVIAYGDVGNSFYGTAVVGTVSGTSISFGTPVIFESAYPPELSITYDSSSNKVVIAYRDNGNSNYGTAVVGTVSGTSISFGTPVVFENAYSGHTACGFDSSNNKVVIAYMDNGNSNYGTAIVGTVSGTSISFGSATVFETAQIEETQMTFDSGNNKIIIAYKDAGNLDYGTAVVGTVSGTSISFGTPVVFEAANTQWIKALYDTTNSKVFLAYVDRGASDTVTGIVGTVSGTSISFGTPVAISGTGCIEVSAAIDNATAKIYVTYRDGFNSGYSTVAVGSINGTSLSFETPVQMSTNRPTYNSSVYDTNSEKLVTSYKDELNSNYGTSVVFQAASTNITAENYIGISSTTVADTETATIDIIGTTNNAQSGLTAGQKYYVQNDGTLSTTADDPSVLAGTALSATKLVVKT